MKLPLFSLLLAATVAGAEEAPTPLHVDVGSAYENPSAFPQRPNAVVRGVPHHDPVKSELPANEERDAAFARVAGLAPRIAGFDDVDRDLLFIRARAGNRAHLRAEYPAIPAELLEALVAAVGKGER